MIIGIYKEKGPTSHDVVQNVRNITGEKVGHAGTLDPLARGVLVVGIGKSTKDLNNVLKKEKEYIADIKLGMTSTTDDEDGEKNKFDVKSMPVLEDIEKVIKNFIGNIFQTPPPHSAIKIEGMEAYKLARKGIKVKMEPRKVDIFKIEILEYQYPMLKIKVLTGPGVYIRSLARDIGEVLETGGYLADLERTRVGDFTKENSYNILELKEKWPIKE